MGQFTKATDSINFCLTKSTYAVCSCILAKEITVANLINYCKFVTLCCIQRKSVDSGEAMSKYSSQYEASLDPFAAFGAKEKQRKYTQLSGPDKATLVLVSIHASHSQISELNTVQAFRQPVLR